MRLRCVCSVGSALLAIGLLAPGALASKPGSEKTVGVTGGVAVGGASAPVKTGPTGATGVTAAPGTNPASTTASTPGASTSAGATTGVTGSIAATAAPSITTPLAPIVLAKGSSPAPAYTGPVFQAAAGGVLVPYVAQTVVATVSGGTIAGIPTDGPPHLVVPGSTAEIVQGIAAAPEDAPAAVQKVIWAANRIIGRPYVYGGGHSSFISYGYDCSGTVSFALHGGHLLKAPLDSSQFMSWGASGQGQWITVLTDPAHAYLDVAGLRLDTSSADDPTNEQGPRWRPLRPGNPGYTLRHPFGL